MRLAVLCRRHDRFPRGADRQYAAKIPGLTGADVVTGCEVTAVDPVRKVVTAKTANGTVEESYDKLIIATGAVPFVPAIEGTTPEGVFCMRTPDDATGLKAYVKATGARRAVVAGAGLIGLEVAENLRSPGLDVTVIDAAMQIMPNALDAETADYAARKEEGKTIVLTLHDRTPP